MTYCYPFSPDINLHVQGRITQEDAHRQTLTAQEILKRLEDQPGLILADEVGMGKTYVALAVAISVALDEKEERPVVVMIPPALREKWPRDFDVFCEHCLPRHLGGALRCATAERTVEFFKLLDDPPDRRRHVIFLTHGAMSRRLADPWVRLALIQRSLYRRHKTGALRAKIEKALPILLQMQSHIEYKHPGMLSALLESRPDRWLNVMARYGYEPEDGDDPVPEMATAVLEEMDLRNIYELLDSLPERRSKYYTNKIRDIRQSLSAELYTLWGDALKRLKLRLPLLIMDEAHHLKNARTQLSTLFNSVEAEEDAQQIERGPLGSVFERMLFLTATPFQLGHHELCSVLERFKGIVWSSTRAPSSGLHAFSKAVEALRGVLDEAQQAALRLDITWGMLNEADLRTGVRIFESSQAWWHAIDNQEGLTDGGRQVMDRYRQALGKMRVAQEHLRRWVIRHLRSRHLPAPFTMLPRRQRFPGASIEEGVPPRSSNGGEASGIVVDGEALLPFLLAARSAAISPSTRPVFAEGLASSYEAFLRTRELTDQAASDGKSHLTDEDDDAKIDGLVTDDWHLERLTELIRRGGNTASEAHPKVAATVDKALRLWVVGEKVLVFCHYVVTGRLLRSLISGRIADHLSQEAARLLGCSPAEADVELGRIGDRFFDSESPWRAACDREVKDILIGYPGLIDLHDALTDMVRRYVRTPTFLVRFFPLNDMGEAKKATEIAFNKKDASGLTLKSLLADFFEFLCVRCGVQEKNAYLQALESVQVGAHRGGDVPVGFSDDELQGVRSEQLLPNVRLVNGDTRKDTRQRLMLSFNTPFYPEILIASSVLAEGVDLHLNCREVIHHDLSWNPSSLEQRNGRVDRIGAKAERCGQSIDVFYPYIAETQDDKMYQVVMDRERWFNVVMGERYKVDARSTEKLAERLPFPETAAKGLAFDLGLIKGVD